MRLKTILGNLFPYAQERAFLAALPPTFRSLRIGARGGISIDAREVAASPEFAANKARLDKHR